ncbi:hypothetical protein KC640_01140, partial [Candidatus Dojkabacteria bacterium]|nr:hypothetical protein [Candidatus Dojkabacteria bacterium]
IKVIDRGYLSTLTFYSVLEEVTGVSANPVYRWFISEIGNTLYRPDHYVFVDVPAEVSVERAKKAGRAIADNNMWLKFPDKINYWYKRMFAVFEPAAKVYRIDGTKSQLDVAEEFRSLLEMLKTGNEG